MSSDDLLSHATSSHDFYALLDIKPTAAESDIKRGYRRAALKYHPDKVGDDPTAKEKFHWIGIANAVLLDVAARAAYDAAREAKQRQAKESEKLEEGRRKMAEALERGEKESVRQSAEWGRNKRMKVGEDAEDAEGRLQREIRRIQEANRKRMDEKQKARQESLEALEEQVKRDKEVEEKERAETDKASGLRVPMGGTAVNALERTVKVKWVREGLGEPLDKDGLPRLFTRFGNVQHASSNREKDKRQRVGDSKEKKLVATGFVVFESIVGAHAAVQDVQKQKGKGDEWDIIESVQWQIEPKFNQDATDSPQPGNQASPSVGAGATAPSTPTPKAKSNHFMFSRTENGGTPIQRNGEGLKKVPSFASFSKAAVSTPKTSPMSTRLGPNSPSLEELTMMRLKEKERERERKRLNEQLEREEAASAEAL